MFVCYRSAGWSQDHIRTDCKLYGIYDVTCVTGCIFGLSDVQPGILWRRSAIQEPSGFVTRRFLQARSLEGQSRLWHFSCMMNRIFVNRLFGMSWFVGGGILVCERHVLSSVLRSVITLQVNEIVILPSSFETLLKYVIQSVVVVRTIY